MRFRVPQFIDIEDKIFGPFTFKEFVYLAGGAGLSYVLYKVLPVYLAIPLVLVVASFSLCLTFVKINNKPFLDVLQSFFVYLFQTKLYVWSKEQKTAAQKKEEAKKPEAAPKFAPKLTESRLKDVAWSLDVLDLKRK